MNHFYGKIKYKEISLEKEIINVIKIYFLKEVLL